MVGRRSRLSSPMGSMFSHMSMLWDNTFDSRCFYSALCHRPAWDDPAGLQAGDGGDVVEVGVVVQDDGAVVFGDGGGEDAGTSGRTMLAAASSMA